MARARRTAPTRELVSAAQIAAGAGRQAIDARRIKCTVTVMAQWFVHLRYAFLNQARHSGARASANLRCVITHEGISATTSGFRVRRAASPRNDDLITLT